MAGRLTALDLSRCSLTALPGAWPAGLTELNLSGCSSLTALPGAWPAGLTRLNLSWCSSLTALPGAWPAGLTELDLSRCDSLSDDSRLAALSFFLDQNFDQGMKLLSGFAIKDSAKLQELLVPKLEKKLADQTTNPDELLVAANFIYKNAEDC